MFPFSKTLVVCMYIFVMNIYIGWSTIICTSNPFVYLDNGRNSRLRSMTSCTNWEVLKAYRTWRPGVVLQRLCSAKKVSTGHWYSGCCEWQPVSTRALDSLLPPHTPPHHPKLNYSLVSHGRRHPSLHIPYSHRSLSLSHYSRQSPIALSLSLSPLHIGVHNGTALIFICEFSSDENVYTERPLRFVTTLVYTSIVDVFTQGVIYICDYIGYEEIEFLSILGWEYRHLEILIIQGRRNEPYLNHVWGLHVGNACGHVFIV